jgi:translation initiation factor IF-3
MRKTWRRAKPKDEKNFLSNERIRVSNIFLIDENGEKIGIVETSKAKQMAEEAGLDLVEVNPTAEPPICKIMDFGQFKYEKEKKIHKQKVQQKKIDTKGIRLSVRISQHDLDMRFDQAKKFLTKGNKLKLELILKGREKAHPEKATELIDDFVKKLENDPTFSLIKEQDLTKMGGRFNIILVNKK